MHGSGTAAARAAGEARRVEAAAEQQLAKVRKLWDPEATPVTSSVAELQRLAGSARVALDALGAELDQGEVCEECGRGPERNPVHLVAWQRQQRLLAQVLEAMGRLGIDERRVEHEAWQLQLVALGITAVFDALEASPEQRDVGRRVLFKTMRAAAGQLEQGPAAS